MLAKCEAAMMACALRSQDGDTRLSAEEDREMERWEAERIAILPRWTGYLAVAIYGPFTLATIVLDAMDGWSGYNVQPEVAWAVWGWGVFGALVGIWMVRTHDKATERLKRKTA
jgi:hypothetical protein